MFENLLGQIVSDQLIQDIKAGVLAPAMLFSGPEASGKGTAALELGRVISCETGLAEWNCSCAACSRHRLLIHPDLLCLGWKPFSAEIAASAGTFQREIKNPSSRLLFVRSIRKLLARFSPVLWEDDPKASKISPLVNSLEEDLDSLELLASRLLDGSPEPETQASLEKLTDEIKKSAFKLESEGMGSNIPIAQIRRAAWWSRLSPTGKEKLLILENADRMQEDARNSLLKLLEEPPGRSRYVLCTSRQGSFSSTILSRLRPYRFSPRDAAVESEIIRRVFRDETAAQSAMALSATECGINAYLDSFLPVSSGMLEALAAFFAASVAYKAALLSKSRGDSLPDEVVSLGKYCAPKAEAAGLGRPNGDSVAVIALVLEKADKFEARSLFHGFLFSLLEQVSMCQRSAAADPFKPAYYKLWKKCSLWAETAVGLYKLRPAQTLEKLFTDLSLGMSKL
ncbi:MAG: DNA polymerase III [Treponema sp.]|nr:DNA polymerase III [Treponema sp.]